MISLIVGLGNPGDNYKKTRHNAGFLMIDSIAEYYGGSFKYEAKFKADMAKCSIEGKMVRLLKPQTYMNKSGQSVVAGAKYFDIPTEEILIIHDELDINTGEVRLKMGGGHGGHNGLRDIIAHLSSKNFYRLRIGIGRPKGHNKVVDYVLKEPSKEEKDLLGYAMDRVMVQIPAICSGEYPSVMQKLHTEEKLKS